MYHTADTPNSPVNNPASAGAYDLGSLVRRQPGSRHADGPGPRKAVPGGRHSFRLALRSLAAVSLAAFIVAFAVTAQAQTPSLSIADASATEGSAVVFTVTLSATTALDVTVQYTTSTEADDTATAGDFTAASSETLTISAGATTGTISVATTEDTTVENDETLR